MRRARQRMAMLGLTWASYLVDALLLWLLAGTGAVRGEAAAIVGTGGTVLCAVFAWCFRRPWVQGLADPYLTVPQMAAAAGLQLVVCLVTPEAALLALMVLFIVFAFAAMRLAGARLLAAWLGVAGGIAWVVLRAPVPLALPAGSTVQSLLSATWLSLVLGRCAVVGMYGASVRQQLGQRTRELAEMGQRLEDLAMRDPLTGALNRRAVMQVLQEALGHEGGRGVSVALADLDHFKRINDERGHPVGDVVLRWVVRELAASLRSQDRLARYGGEEFLVVLRDQNGESTLAVAQRLREAVRGADWQAVGAGLAVTMSIGVAQAREGESPEALLKRADDALYRAKHQGRDRVVAAAD